MKIRNLWEVLQARDLRQKYYNDELNQLFMSYAIFIPI